MDLWNMKVTVIPIVISALIRITKGKEGSENNCTSGDHPNYSIKIGENTQKGPGDLRGLAITQTNKWYVHNPASVLEHNSHKFL